MTNILLFLPLGTVEDVLLPFALEYATEVANTGGKTVRIFVGSGSGRIACEPGVFFQIHNDEAERLYLVN